MEVDYGVSLQAKKNMSHSQSSQFRRKSCILLSCLPAGGLKALQNIFTKEKNASAEDKVSQGCFLSIEF